MGHRTKEIAYIKEPAKVSLANNPNFVEFRELGTDQQMATLAFTDFPFAVYSYLPEQGMPDEGYSTVIEDRSQFVILEVETGIRHPFKGVFDDHLQQDSTIKFIEDKSEDYVLYSLDVDWDYNKLLANIKNCLLDNVFLREKFNIYIQDEGSVNSGQIIFEMKDKKEGAQFPFILEKEDPDFIRFQRTNVNQIPIYMLMQFLNPDISADKSKIEFKAASLENPLLLEGTRDKDKVNSTTFFLDNNRESIAENVRACLMQNSYFRGNFDIIVKPVANDAGGLQNGDAITMVSKRGEKNVLFSAIIYDSDFISLSGNGIMEDVIDNRPDGSEIQLDIYKNTGVFPGISNYNKMGTYTTTLSKSYFGKPLWFDVNTIWQNENRYSDEFLTREGWCNAGTCNDFRFVAKRFNGYTNTTFYYSDVLYALTGYTRNLGTNNLSEYVYDGTHNVKPLTQQPRLPHIKGQSQYFNFFMSDSFRDDEVETHELGILYKMYSQSGGYLGTAMFDKEQQDMGQLFPVNTIRLLLDAAISDYPQAGIVKVYLCHKNKVKSYPLTFHILPDCLYKLKDFAFLNALGGWSSFNFGGTEQVDFKSDVTSIYKTQTPDYTQSSHIESVFNKEVNEQFVVHTGPIKAEVADWLKELSASIAVYELSTHRYIVVDELNVKHNSKDDLFTLQMKYHYSDAYNANIK